VKLELRLQGQDQPTSINTRKTTRDEREERRNVYVAVTRLINGIHES
jgi:ATP-dependent exoDNAse (exonuclease V) beta subunit